MHFSNRTEAGRLLAGALETYKGNQVIVFALPRGGVVLGAEVARRLEAPLDLIIARKIGHPHSPEYAVGAVTEDGHLVRNEQEIVSLDPEWLDGAVKREQTEAKRRRLRYLRNRPGVTAKAKVAIIVDDGIATGLTMQTAIQAVKDRHPAKIVVAVPVVPSDTAQLLREQVNELVALEIPEAYLGAVGAYYDVFEQVDDATVIKLLDGPI